MTEHYIIQDESFVMSCSACGSKPIQLLAFNDKHHICSSCFVKLSISKSVEMKNKQEEQQ